MLKGIIFDMDGVIADTEFAFIESKHIVLKELGVHVDFSYHTRFVGTTFEFMWAAMKEEFGFDAPIEKCIKKADALRRKLLSQKGLNPIKGVVPLIQSLHEYGLLLAVASSSPIEDIENNVTLFGVKNYFTALVSGTTVPHSKPSPDIFLKAAAEIGLQPSDCLVIEDSKSGVQGAKSAGMACLGFRNTDYPLLDISKADAITENFDQIRLPELLAVYEKAQKKASS